MQFRGLLRLTVAVLCAAFVCPPAVGAQTEQSQATFKSSVDLVSVSAVVRDKKGRVVRALTQRDFVVTDAGLPRTIVDLHADETAPASIALLVDGSGSMRLGDATGLARQICDAILASLRQNHDLAALMSFDTRLLMLREFTGEFDQIKSGLGDVAAFGSTSIYDAIAGSAARVAERTKQRRAVVVLTDGSDNASTYSPDEVAWIASTIDVPVYVFAVGGLSPEGTQSEQNAAVQRNTLFELARATGGDYFFASSPTLAQAGTARMLDELRHQYLIAFEPSAATGVRRLDVRTRNADLKVRARRWYAPAAGD
jgi:VWFA-related protein